MRPGVALAAALVACGAASAATAGEGVTAVAMTPGPARPAESGGHDSAATRGPLAIGANVTDRSGAEIGHITRLTTDKAGGSIAEIRQNEDVFSIPIDDLYAHGGAAVSALTLEELKHSGAAH
jgi:hypothetical protein